MAVVILAIFSPQAASLTWTLIGVAFVSAMFLSVALIAVVVLPSYQLRMIGAPLVLILLFWFKASNSASYQGRLNIPLGMWQWIVTFTAVTLLVPQTTSMIAFIERLFRRT